MAIYLDNAATTLIDPAVLTAMLPYLTQLCGNPSSIHRYGCQAKSAVEKARKKIAQLLNIAPAELVFTSGGTEGNNMLLRGIVEAKQIKYVLTSELEHLSVRMPLVQLAKQGKLSVTYLPVDGKGTLAFDAIEKWLKRHSNALVSFMHVNHEIGNVTDIERIGLLCRQYGAYFHSDMVQGMYCFSHDFSALPIQLAVGSGHKIHAPKGIGFAYIEASLSVDPLIYGGSQELNRRGGTENVAYIVGLAQALEIAYRDRTKTVAYLLSIKQYMIALLKACLPNVIFNGHSSDLTRSNPALLSITLPGREDNDMLIHNLAIHGIAAAEGSACSSGSAIASPVIAALQGEHNQAIRFSFSKYTTHEEIAKTVEVLRHLAL
ncbi:cysteine desulfurase family protein [Candidatus Cardinium hertigii]|uniref:Cysteine desulfurase IscS n=1 Tax=Candidatus Cardinium hertigii TaxID=247481 RepID=A0A2Z3LET9_9BACT|nr:cysteine desulfurase family protein [Candidatus Cardinium hertigii]AWN82206.1 Cysteine desulfurase IscS [Candidatus Cardinium hertigii]